MTENVSSQNFNTPPLNFDDTEIAFRSKTDRELEQAERLFKVINNPMLAKIGPVLANFALGIGLPVTGIIKNTLFKQFCGGETVEDSEAVIQSLWEANIGTILDYSVEGVQQDSSYSSTAAEITRIIQKASSDERIPFAVFKLSGIARLGLLQKISSGEELTAAEETEYFKVKGRINNICKTASDCDVPVLIDAEESWIQKAIDNLAVEMMQLYNLERAIVYNTYQLYLTSALPNLKAHYEQAETYGFILGAKLVRGAYLEKERERATVWAYTSPVHESKEATDAAYNDALKYCVQHIKYIAFVAGTHNEESCRLLVKYLHAASVPPNHPHVYFSQLLGMSDNLSFNLANAGFNVTKYVPYGPVKSVLPYLFRRAEENSAISGQMGRELSLIVQERKRRGTLL